MNAYKIIRRIHLYSAIVVMVFLAMYFITGFLLVRYNWFDHEESPPVTKEYELSLPDNTGLENSRLEEIAAIVRSRFCVTGKLEFIRRNSDGSFLMKFLKPGMTTNIKLDPGTKKIILEHRKHNLYRLLSTYHRLHGYGGGTVYDLYLAFMDLASLSLIVFVLSGIYLWLKILRNKGWGIFFLVAGLVYTAWIFLSFMYY